MQLIQVQLYGTAGGVKFGAIEGSPLSDGTIRGVKHLLMKTTWHPIVLLLSHSNL